MQHVMAGPKPNEDALNAWLRPLEMQPHVLLAAPHMPHLTFATCTHARPYAVRRVGTEPPSSQNAVSAAASRGFAFTHVACNDACCANIHAADKSRDSPCVINST